VRGASALQDLLQNFGGAPVAAFVVWEPILITDAHGPRASALARVRDRRAAQFWDPAHEVSRSMGGPASFGPKSGAKILFDMKKHVWDFAAVYAPGFRWRDSGGSPLFAGAPVVEVTTDLRAAISAALLKTVDR
jgi:hypothetical protein